MGTSQHQNLGYLRRNLLRATNVCFSRKRTFKTLKNHKIEGQLTVYSVEKLCFEKSDDFICVLSVVLYCRYEGIVRNT